MVLHDSMSQDVCYYSETNYDCHSRNQSYELTNGNPAFEEVCKGLS
jgi:hypothetical protein